MVDHVLHPGEVGVSDRRRAVLPAPILPQASTSPVGNVERRIGQNVVGLQIGMPVVVESVSMGNLALDASDGQVHLGQSPSRVVRFLAVDGDVGPDAPRKLATVAVAGGVGADELHRLHEHPRGAAAGVVDPALIWLQHFHQQLDDAARRVEFAPLLALGAGELRQKILVDAAQHILGAGLLIAHLDVADEIDNLAQAGFVQRRASVVFGQHALQNGIVPFDAGHGIVHQPADGGLFGSRLQLRPARFARHPEDVLGAVFVRVLRVGSLSDFSLQPAVGFLEGVGDVLEEDQTQDDVFVLGRIHAAAQGVGHLPELSLIAHVGGALTFWL